jgi:hypothetical protein
VNDNGGHIAVILCRLAGLDYAFQGLQYFLTLRWGEPSVAAFVNDCSGDLKPLGPEGRKLLLGLALSSLFGFLALEALSLQSKPRLALGGLLLAGLCLGSAPVGFLLLLSA